MYRTAASRSSPTSRRWRLLLADDNDSYRGLIRSLLTPAFDIVAEGGDGQQAVDLAIATQPDVALLDLQMPNLDGVAAAQHIIRLLPGTGVVILSANYEEPQVVRAIRAGVLAYVLKDDSPRRIVDAVSLAASGQNYLSPRVAGVVMRVAAHFTSIAGWA